MSTNSKREYSCKFLHFREVNSVLINPELGNASAKKTVVNSRNGMTIAYEELPNGGGFLFSGAKCHENDNFNKRVARDKAAGRLQSKDKKTVFEGTFDEFYNFITLRANELNLSRVFSKKSKTDSSPEAACSTESCGCDCSAGEYNASPNLVATL